MRLYFEYIKLHFKSLIQYKISFILSCTAQLFIFFTYYFMVIALFAKFGNIKGFTVYEVLLALSIIQFGFSFNEMFGRGIDKFDDLIINGDFDIILLKPRGILLQVLCSKFDLVKLLRIIQSIIVLIIALVNLDIEWNILKVITLLFMMISSILIFFGIFVLAASYCFITIQGLEVRNMITDGGKNMAQYPIGIFKKGFIFFFTFIIPYGFVNYYPLLYFIGRTDNYLLGLSPLFVVLFLIPCLLSFKLGCKKYSSCGS